MSPYNIRINYDGQLRWVSELIYIDDYVPNLTKIEYYMSYNTDMFYATGINLYVRFIQDLSQAVQKGENEKYSTDTDTKQIDVSNYRMNTFQFLPLTKEVARQLIEIFSCDNITINGIGYTTESISLEALGNSNLYVPKVTMIERGTGLGVDTSGTYTVTIPTLIETGTGKFTKIS